ncbi:MAG: F0F1 ATP synthase subunit delta [Campylobacterales bacterium]|nr:F0F1 ATP synthase subunit delta [Campylobacterales bacterium]
MEDLVAGRYVKALLDAAPENKKAEYIETLNALSDAFTASNIAAILESPIVSSEDKLSMVMDALGSNVDDKMSNFIKILADKKRLALIPNITSIINMQIQKESNEYKGIVISNEALSETSLKSLEETLAKYTGSNIELSQTTGDVDGMKVSVEDLGIEVSFSKDRVKQQLIDYIKKSL